jgi:hypothetical protein
VILVLALAGMLGAAGDVKVSSPRRVRLGGVVVSAGYSHFSGPYDLFYYSPCYFPFFYDWAWYSPFFHPGFYDGFVQGPGKGEIKLRTALDKAEVYLDAAYAGYASDLKSFWLAPGAYNLEVRADNREPYARRIYVLSGKVLRIEAPLSEKKP